MIVVERPSDSLLTLVLKQTRGGSTTTEDSKLQLQKLQDAGCGELSCNPEYVWECYMKCGRISQTSSSTVLSVLDRKAFSALAIKSFHLSDYDAQVDDVLAEMSLISRAMRHPGVVAYREHFLCPSTQKVHVVMENLRGPNLLRVVLSKSHFREPAVRAIMSRLLSTLSHLHGLGIVHRHVKLKHLVLARPDKPGSVKLVDFAFAAQREDDAADLDHAAFTGVLGSPMYIAPEILSGNPYGTKCDLWSAGVVMLSLLTGRLAASVPELISAREGKFAPGPNLSVLASPESLDLLGRLLQTNPRQRISAREALDHPWFSKESLPGSPGGEPRMRYNSYFRVGSPGVIY